MKSFLVVFIFLDKYNQEDLVWLNISIFEVFKYC